ncbi:MAG: type III pantothenate kinase [Oscillospiraceae bacterium]|jgi:type III pantothenate kinase|nr:type III pantothenate kinase [Oscillospiraceae bacterium]
MILAIDIGNTNISIGAYSEDRLLFVSRVATDRSRTEDQYAVEIRQIFHLNDTTAQGFTGAIISSVVPELTNSIKTAIHKITKHNPLVVGPGLKNGLKIEVDNPGQLGADLAAAAVGAIHKYPLPCLVMDLGTATKISVIDGRGVFRGVTISAGVGISLDALSQRTSQLPQISIEAPESVIGTNTIACMQSGLVCGTACMLDGLCGRIEEELGERAATIVSTGGYSLEITKECRRDVVYDPNLLLDGLKVIYDKNKKQ